VVVVSAQVEDIEAIAVDDITVEMPPSAEQASAVLALAQQSPTP
jgi:hypothetical protein